MILYIGLFFFDREIKYSKLFEISLKAEFVFILVIISKIGWFYFFQNSYKLDDIQYFFPLSALNIVGYEDIKAWFIYPLQVFNLFELAYWFILSYLIAGEINISMDKGFKIVASSYGPAILIWVVAVMFFTLNYS